MQLQENDWLFINNMTYKIHEILDFDKMRMDFLRSIKLAINYDCATFYLADMTKEGELCDPIGVNFTDEQLNDYLENFLQLDYFKSMSSSPSSYVLRETDLFSEKKRVSSEYYQRAYKPMNLHYSLLLGLVFENEYLASVIFYRAKDKEDFSDKDIAILELLKNHLALRLGKEMGLYSPQNPKESERKSIEELCQKSGLTERETEVVGHMYRGDTPREICDELHIAETTLKKHITNSYKKLNIGCRAQLYKVLNKTD